MSIRSRFTWLSTGRVACLALGLAVFPAISQAPAAVVTFDDTSLPNTSLSLFSDGGLTFDNHGGTMYVWDSGSPNSNGTNNNVFNGEPSSFERITRTGGGTFNLNSIDLAISWYDSNPTETITINGSSLDITQILTTYTLNLIGVSQVDISGFARSSGGFWLADNINYSTSAVPLPAALPLFAAGLGVMGLLGWRRKRKAMAEAAA